MSSVDQRIRQVAIVMQSLDASTAKGLLAQLPADLARSVRQMMTKLGNVSSRERANAFESLEGMLGAMMGSGGGADPSDSPASALLSHSGGQLDRVEISPELRSSGTETDRDADKTREPLTSGNQTEIPWLSWDPATLATYLVHERPAVIATVINQFSPERAKALLDHLPIQIASSTLVALPHLTLSDPSILNDILAEVDKKLPKTPPVLTAATVAGISKLEAIIAQFGETQRAAWLESIAAESEEVAMQLGWAPRRETAIASTPIQELPSESITPVRASELSQETVHDKKTVSSQTLPSRFTAPGKPTVQPSEPDIFEDPVTISIDRYREAQNKDAAFVSRQIAQGFIRVRALPLNDLVTLLHACDRDQVILMLKGADDVMRKQVEQVVAPQDLKRFKQLLAGLPPESELVWQALESILEKLDALIATGRINPLATSSILVAA